jgi:hypothetical protein
MPEVVTSTCFPLTIEDYAQLIAIPGEVGIELDDQPCIGREGDGFEQFLQPPALELLDCPVVGWEDWARELDAWEVD